MNYFRFDFMCSVRCNSGDRKKVLLPFTTIDNEVMSLHEYPLYSDEIVPYSESGQSLREVPVEEDYFDDVHIGLHSVIDAGKHWMVINKPSFLSLDDDPKSNSRYSVKRRLLSFLERPHHQFVAKQIGLDSAWYRRPTLWFPYPLDKGVSGSLFVAFSRDVNDFVLNEVSKDSILESMLAVVHFKNAFGLKTFDFRSNEIWANFEAELTRKKSNFKDIEGSPRGERVDIHSKWRCVATDNEEEGFALLQFQYKRRVKHQVQRLCALNRTPVVGDDRYVDVHGVDIAKGIGNLGDMEYQPFITKYGRPRLGLHVGRIKVVVPHCDLMEKFKRERAASDEHKNILRPDTDRMHRKNFKSPIPLEFKNLFSKGLKFRAARFAVDER